MREYADVMAHPPFAVTVDLVVFTIRDDTLCALTIERGETPFKGRLALPGGFVHIDEDVENAAIRELAEETGIGATDRLHLEQLRTYGTAGRDPRMRTVSVAYLALAADLPAATAGGDAATAQWTALADLEPASLAFDHGQILADGLERARAKLEYTTLATSFCPTEFTIGELRHVYELVWGVTIDPRNFHRKIQASEGFVQPTGDTTTRGRGRPAQLFRAGPANALHPPIVR
ncbi:MAG: NUDIX hydrolase [Acidimicrobiales bacterium]